MDSFTGSFLRLVEKNKVVGSLVGVFDNTSSKRTNE